MSEKKTRLAQAITDEQTVRGLTDRQAAAKIGVLQQTFSAWKAGTVPRQNVHARIAAFLRMSIPEFAAVVDEATSTIIQTSIGVYSTVRVYGRISDRKEGRFKFDTGRKSLPEGRYAVIVDTKIMEPVFRVGCKVWLDPGIWPQVGDDVMVHSRGLGWIGRLVEHGPVMKLERYAGPPIDINNVEAVHAIVLTERVVGMGAKFRR